MFHTVSQFSADRLAHFFPQIASRICVVPNAVTPHFFTPVPEDGEAFLSEHGLAARAFVLVPGGLHFRKNADLILEVAPILLQRFPGLILAIVNHSNSEYAARASAISENVRVLGFVSDEALHALYAAASVVWFPSRYEGFGLPVIEAMACGAPVVASDASSIPEVAGRAALLADPSRPEDHVEAIAALLADAGMRQRLAAAGRDRASQFTWACSATKLKQAFDALV
jgi:glycosyltransferase involved in cell wall biosynthesis